MKKYILIFLLLLYPSTLIADGTLIVYNYCDLCSYINVIVTVPATAEESSYDVWKTLWGYGASVGFDLPRKGTYGINAYCSDEESISWYSTVSCDVCDLPYYNVTLEEYLDCETTTTTTTTIGGVVILNHMMTRNSSGCDTPIPTDTFYDYDAVAYCWSYYGGISIGDEIEWKWYQPDGKLYQENSLNSNYSGYACAWQSIYIKGYTPANTPSTWCVDVYFEGVKKFTEYFTIIGSDSTTSTTPPTTTTPAASSTTTMPSTITTTTGGVVVTTTTTAPVKGRCSSELIYGEDSEETEILRYIRDEVLNQTPEGRELIRLYYQLSPILVKAMENDEEFKEEVKEIIDGVLGLIGETE